MKERLPSAIHQEDGIEQMNRRKFTSVLLGAGFSFSTATSVSAESVSDSDRDEIPIVVAHRKSDDPDSVTEPVEKKVPTRWYDNLTKARREHQQFIEGKEIAGHTISDEDVLSAWVSAGTLDKQEPYIEIEVVNTEPHPLGYIESNEVPVQIKSINPPESEDEERELGESDTPTGPEDINRQGGQAVADEDGSYGTLGTPVHDGDDVYFLACEHIGANMRGPFNDPIRTGGGFSEGDTAYTNFDSEIGEVVEADCSDDIAVIEPTSNYQPEFSVVGETDPIVGHIDEDGLADMESNNEEVQKYGQTTNHTSGVVKSHSGVTIPYAGVCGTIRTNQLKWGDQSASDAGDSGSPVYTDDYTDDSEIFIAGGIDGAWPDFYVVGDYAFGTAAYHIHNEYGYHYNDPSEN